MLSYEGAGDPFAAQSVLQINWCVAMQAFGPLVFYDVNGQMEEPASGSSIVNVMEVEMVLCVYRELVHAYPELRNKPSVAVISPYKAQVCLTLLHA